MLTYGFGFLNPNIDDIPRDGLVIEYLCEGNADDTSGNGFDGTVNGATLVNDDHGVPNSAYLFDGINDSISKSFESGLNQDIVSIAFKVKINTFDNLTNAWIYSQWDVGGNVAVFLRSGDSTKIQFVYNDGTFTVRYESSIILNTGQWYQITCIHPLIGPDRIYIDGVLDAAASYAVAQFYAGIISTATDLYIGAQSDNTEFFDGTITKIRKYRRELTQSEITAIADE